MQHLEINSIKVFFDKEKTQKNITNNNEPCDCQDCRNYYKNMESNTELKDFLNQFGIDYLRTEEVISYELRLKDKNSPIHSMAYYVVFGYIEKEFSVKKGDYTILFKKNADVNVGHEGDDEYFWIVLDMVIPYVLEEERELSYVSGKTNIFTKIEALVSKIFTLLKINEEWSYLCDSNSMLPAMWEPHSNGWSGSRFENIDDLMKELIFEPEYKQFFS